MYNGFLLINKNGTTVSTIALEKKKNPTKNKCRFSSPNKVAFVIKRENNM